VILRESVSLGGALSNFSRSAINRCRTDFRPVEDDPSSRAKASSISGGSCGGERCRMSFSSPNFPSNQSRQIPSTSQTRQSFSAARLTDLNHLTGMRVGIRVFDVTGAVIKTEEHTGDVRES
jgi:hypothetical protein